ncbi:hypothetical protein KC19_6G166300 [Ceratodon purpureus]|uniref:Uncharacterized protein n=1 Tax=Ceratodon purpureus TaxID=3225 RepID=A0A8T0HHV2_CERPU|nr:hypothetical protein KC19_6G166300 [Ceratodon purpureus]
MPAFSICKRLNPESLTARYDRSLMRWHWFQGHHNHNVQVELRGRNDAIGEDSELLIQWHAKSGYLQRSLVEVTAADGIAR